MLKYYSGYILTANGFLGISPAFPVASPGHPHGHGLGVLHPVLSDQGPPITVAQIWSRETEHRQAFAGISKEDIDRLVNTYIYIYMYI